VAESAARPISRRPSLALAHLGYADFWWRSAWIVLVGIVVADVLTDNFPLAGAAGTVLWLVSYIYVIVFGLVAARDLIRSSEAAAAPFGIFVVVMYLVITIVNVGTLRNFSSETAIEIGCAVHYLNAGGSLGFHQTCLFGYPMRQFLLPVLPTLAFGPSLANMNVGSSVYFLVGVIIFAAGVTKSFRSAYMGNLVGALLLSAFLQLHWWNHFYLIFEQSIYPLSLALVLCGLFLYYRLGDERRVLPLMGLVLLWIIGSYPPSLATYGLAAVALLYTAYVRPDIRVPALVLFALSAVSFWVSLGYRHDLNVGSGSTMDVRANLWLGFQHLIYQNYGIPWTTPFLVFPMVVAVALAVSGVLGRLAIPVGLWVAGVFAFAIISHGYSLNSIDVRMHRALVAFPVLLTLVAVALSSRRLARMRNALEVLLLVFLLIGVKYYADYRESIPPTPAIPFVSWLHAHVPNEGTSAQPMTMTLFPNSIPDLPGSLDSLRYFSPNVQVSYLDPSRLGPGCPGLTGLKGIIVALPATPCTHMLQEKAASGRVHYAGTYSGFSTRLVVFTA
jgi:hypothetical protein